jgi:hypothetical protein
VGESCVDLLLFVDSQQECKKSQWVRNPNARRVYFAVDKGFATHLGIPAMVTDVKPPVFCLSYARAAAQNLASYTKGREVQYGQNE